MFVIETTRSGELFVPKSWHTRAQARRWLAARFPVVFVRNKIYIWEPGGACPTPLGRIVRWSPLTAGDAVARNALSNNGNLGVRSVGAYYRVDRGREGIG